MNKSSLTQQRLMQAYHYDPETGLFRRIGSKGPERIGTIPKVKGNGYLNIGLDYNVYRAHRLAWLYVHGSWPDGQIDHINGDKLDNRISNLRVATTSQNKQNMRKARSDSRSGLIGATWYSKYGKWRAAIQVDGKKRHLGYFDTAEEAHKAFIEQKRLHHEFCTI
jgi:hypothetical protein